MLTVTFIAIAQGSASGGQIGLLIVKQMLFGILFGGLIAAAAVLLLKKIKFSTAGFDMVFVVGIAVIGYCTSGSFWWKWIFKCLYCGNCARKYRDPQQAESGKLF